jgi:hypothetical protein
MNSKEVWDCMYTWFYMYDYLYSHRFILRGNIYIYIRFWDCMCICIMHDYMYLLWLMYVDWQEAYTCINIIYIYSQICTSHPLGLFVWFKWETEHLICLDICNSSNSVSLLRLMRTINLFLLVNHQAVTLETQRVTDWSDCKCYPLVMTNVAIENGLFIADVPIINCDCP